MYRRLIALLFALAAFTLPCFAIDSPNVDPQFSDMISSLPSDVAGLLPPEMFEGVDSAAEGLEQMLEPSFWKGLLGEFILDSAELTLPALSSILAILLISALISTFSNAFRSEALSGAVGLSVSVVMISIFIRLASHHLSLVNGYIERLSRLCLSMLPVMGALLAMGGSGGTAVATHGGFLMLLGIIEAVVGEAFGGIVGISLAMTAASSFSPSLRLSAIASGIRRCFGIFFGAVTALLGFLLSVKIGIASAGDSVAMRGAKIFASNAIPVVGSAIGDSLRTLATAVSYIKSVSGGVCIVLLLLLTLPVFIQIWLYRSGLVLISGAAEMLGCDRERRLISGVVSVYGYILAVIAIITVVFILMLTLFTKCTLAFGGGI